MASAPRATGLPIVPFTCHISAISRSFSRSTCVILYSNVLILDGGSKAMDGLSPGLFLRVEGLQVDHDCLLCVAHDHPMRGRVRRIVGLLVRRERWHINKIARFCFPFKFHMLAPAHHYLARNDVNDGFEFSMMMHSTRCLRLDDGD